MTRKIFWLLLLLSAVAAQAQKLAVTTVSHKIEESDYTYRQPAQYSDYCTIYSNAVWCTGTATSEHLEQYATYRFTEIVIANHMQYTLSRTARWRWSNMDWIRDGDTFQAEIKGRNMYITYRRGGNQGKLHTMKYEVLDIRPIPVSDRVPDGYMLAQKQ